MLTMCVSTKPISKGPPACLMEEMGEAPVPPSWPLIWMMSAFAFATPEATVPMPAWATSFTLTLADGAACSHMVFSQSTGTVLPFADGRAENNSSPPILSHQTVASIGGDDGQPLHIILPLH